jgi:hypothetical protein
MIRNWMPVSFLARSKKVAAFKARRLALVATALISSGGTPRVAAVAA